MAYVINTILATLFTMLAVVSYHTGHDILASANAAYALWCAIDAIRAK